MRSGIRRKLLLLITLLSLALIAASVLISSRLYSDSLLKNRTELCAETADTLQESLESDDYRDFLLDYQEKIMKVYRDHREELEAAEDMVFESADKREEFYESFTKGIFPPKHGIGMSYDMLVFKMNYDSVVENMDMLAYASGMDTASVFVYNREYGNMVYLVDLKPEVSLLYNYPATVEKPWNDQMAQMLESGRPAAFMDDAACYALRPVLNTDDMIYVLFGSSTADLTRNVHTFSLYSFIITLGATLVIGLVVLLFADRLIVRNVKKLTTASEKFTSEVYGGTPEKVSAAITSRDEIGDLSEKFDLLQDSILGYISSLAEKTASEEKMKAELSLAARIQSESLPKGTLKAGTAVLESFLKPAREVGGDLYDYFMLDEKRLFFCLADVSGKGIPAALFMMRAKELIKAGTASSRTLDEFAFRLNNELCTGNEENVFITAFFGILDTESGELNYLRAGHEEPFIRHGNKVVKFAEESNFVLGLFENAEYQAGRIVLEAGDAVLMYTDGLNEGINEEKEEFGYDRIAEAFRHAGDRITAVMYGALLAFCGKEEQFDDVTMLALSFGKEKKIEIRDPDYDAITVVTDTVLHELKGYEQDRVSEVGLMIDEVMNNQISYAFEGVEQPCIRVACAYGGDTVTLTFEDNGMAFDPLHEVTEEQLERSEGGFGISLLKAMSDEQRYVYEDGCNRLTVRKRMR